jgi:CheY-like chemotaxis protein
MIGRVGTSVLVVDDDTVFRGLAGRMLQSLGLTICAEAGTVESALAAARTLKPDSALVDVGLPDGDGIELARRIADLPWRPRVVLTSSDVDAMSNAAASGAAAIPFVPKDQLPNAPLWRLLTSD